MKKLRVTVEGKSYDVTVELLGDTVPSHSAPSYAPPAPMHAIPTAAPVSAAAASAAAQGDVPSPLAGRVVALSVQVGQGVKEGDQLATIEAMKMNTYVFSPRAGTVKRVLVEAGEQVEEGQALLTVE